jgi:signal transduction histidine kinase
LVGYRINAEPVHLGELARDVSQKFQLAAKKKQVALKLEADGDVGFVNADIGLIERTLENLLENSLAHTPPRGCVRLAVRADDDGVTLVVSDTGSGIPPADLPHIFERFYRVDKARTRESSGSGLGLAIVKRIVELHNSEIHVESSAGTGTTFWFTLTAAPMAPLTPG